jgi:hypothetical protein
MSTPISYAQLLETNNLVQACNDETYWLCVTRTVQESKLFPVPAYMLLSYLMVYYRYPELLRKIETRMRAEDIGDRSRNMGIKTQASHIAWCMPGFYLLARELLISMGLIRPQDGVEDLIYLMDFWKRHQLSWHRNDGHISNKEFGHRSQILPERRLQVFEADLFECREGDALHEAAMKFTATVSQYIFLIHCESRIGLANTGPYKFGANRELLVRDFMDLSEGDYPWMDGVAADVPYNNLTIPMVVEDCHFYLVDDWASFESEPEFKAEKVVAVGLYTSDTLSEGYLPVGMGSADELTRTFKELNRVVKDASARLWKRIAGWSRAEMLDAGALTYFSVIKDLAHIAGVYEHDDWMTIDPRAERFRPILNDEYGRDGLGELVGSMTNPGQQTNEYTMMQHSNLSQRMFSPIPYSILNGGDYTPTCGPIQPGTSHMMPKRGKYRTTRGLLELDEYNRLARDFTPRVCQDKFRYLDETWVKYNYDTPLADELYRAEQMNSRTLKDQGAGLKRVDLTAPNAPGACSPAGGDVLHGLAIKKLAPADVIANILGMEAKETTGGLDAAVAAGHATIVKDAFMLTPAGEQALDAAYPTMFAVLRVDNGFIAAYDRFEAVNRNLKQLVTDWQTVEVAGARVPNDHGNKDYDDRIIDRLGALHEQAEGILLALAAPAPRLGRYTERLLAALEKAEDGDTEFVSGVRVDSYHTVWFELHEDLLRILGRERDE